VRELGISTPVAGVDMRLNAGGVRELHWHKAAEWAYMLYGTARITAVDPNGHNFVDDVGVGDLWYFPAGTPHSIQGLNPGGCEFLLVFDEDNTFLISDWFKHVPNDVLAKNFGAPASAFVELSRSARIGVRALIGERHTAVLGDRSRSVGQLHRIGIKPGSPDRRRRLIQVRPARCL
jgi:oxalate decarboxylase family bicupin protein